MDGIIGNLWVKVKADIGDFREKLSGIGKEVPKPAAVKDYGDTAEDSFSSAGMEADVFSSKLASLGMQSAGMGKYARMMGMSFKAVGPQLKMLIVDLKAAGTAFKASATGGYGFVTALKTLGSGLKTAGNSFKTFGRSIMTAMGPLIAIMLIIEAAMWIWNKFKEHQEKVRKQQEATGLAVKSLGMSLEEAKANVKMYGNEWSALSQKMLGYGHSAKVAGELAGQVSELAKGLSDTWKGLSKEDAAALITESLAKGIDGLKSFGIYMTEAELKTYALEKGMIQAGESMDYAKTQAAMLSLITAQLTGGPIKGIPITQGMRDAAKAAQEARKAIGLMGFDALNTIKKQEDAANENPMGDLYSQIAYDADAVGEMGGQLETATTKAKGLGDTIKDALKNAVGWDNVVAGFNNLKDFGGQAWNTIKDTAGNAWNWISTKAGPWLGEKWDGIKSAAGTAWNTVKAIGGGIWDGIKTTATTAWKTVTETIPGMFSSALNKVKGFFGGLFDNVKKGFSNLSDSINKIPIIGDIAKGAGKVVSGIKGFFGLAGGGAVMPGKPGLVTVGDNLKEPEIVAPQSYITEAVADALRMVGGSGGGTQTIILQLDGATVAKQIVRPLTSEQRRLGL